MPHQAEIDIEVGWPSQNSSAGIAEAIQIGCGECRRIEPMIDTLPGCQIAARRSIGTLCPAAGGVRNARSQHGGEMRSALHSPDSADVPVSQ